MKKLNFLFIILTLNFYVFSQNDTLRIVRHKNSYERNVARLNDTVNNFLKKNETFTGVIYKKTFEKYDGYGAEYLAMEDFTNCRLGKKIKYYTINYDNNGNILSKDFSNSKDTSVTIRYTPIDSFYLVDIDTIISKWEDIDYGDGYIQKTETFLLKKYYGFDERKVQTSFQQVRIVLEKFDGLQVFKSYHFKHDHSDSIEFDISTFYDKGKLIDVLSNDALFLDLQGKLISKQEYLTYLKNDDDLRSEHFGLDISGDEQFLIKKMPVVFYLEGMNKRMTNASEKISVKGNKELSKWLKKELEKAKNKPKN